MRFYRKKSSEEKTPKFTIGKKKLPFTITPARRVKDVPAFHQGTSIPVKTKEDLKHIVEEPCLKACQQLFDKNIETMDSGCNGENCSDRAYIVINYDTLDINNKRVADDMVQRNTACFIPKSDECVRHYFNQLYIQIAVSPQEFVSSVETRLSKAIQGFVPQQKIIKKMDPAQIMAMHMRAQSRK